MRKMKIAFYLFFCVLLFSCKSSQCLNHVDYNKCNLYKKTIKTIIRDDLMSAKSRKIVIIKNLIYIKKFDELLNDYFVLTQINSMIVADLNTFGINISTFTKFNNDSLLECEKEIKPHCRFIEFNCKKFDRIWKKSLNTNDLLLIRFSNIGLTESEKYATLYLKSRYSNGNKEAIFFFFEQQMDETYELITYYRLGF